MNQKFIHAIRMDFAILAFVAIIVQPTSHISHGFNTVNFFSYFTNLSNILFALFLLTSAIVMIAGKKPSPLLQFMRGGSVLCMLIVGVVFSLLLRNEDLGTLLPWVNIVLHYLMPIVAIADWVIVPPEMEVTRKHTVLWLVFPLVYLAYSLIRGAANDWYPYPFLNPDKVGGYGGVAVYCLGILALFLLGSWLVAYLANKMQKRNAAAI